MRWAHSLLQELHYIAVFRYFIVFSHVFGYWWRESEGGFATIASLAKAMVQYLLRNRQPNSTG
jgi:hypothetical protein